MTPAALDLLETLRDAGFSVTATQGKVYVKPRERLSEGDTALVVQHKPALLQLLAMERMIPCPGKCRAIVDPDEVEALAAICDRHECPFAAEVRMSAPDYERKPR